MKKSFAITTALLPTFAFGFPAISNLNPSLNGNPGQGTSLEIYTNSSRNTGNFRVPATYQAPIISKPSENGRNSIAGRYALRWKEIDTNIIPIAGEAKRYSGYLDDNVENKHLFYMFLESQSKPETDPIILWLNGGPGMASTGVIWGEIGSKMKPQPHSWNKFASIIFLDQPTKVGLSYGNITSDTKVAARDVQALLSLFFREKPQYSKQPFYIWGFSYGGHWVPAFANEILSHQDQNNPINLKGAIIANGITDPYTQLAHMPDMACGKGNHTALFDKQMCEKMESVYLPQAQKLAMECNKNANKDACIAAEESWQKNFIGRVEKAGYDNQNINRRLPKQNGTAHAGWRPDDFFNKPEVLRALGAENRTYIGDNPVVFKSFKVTGDIALSMVPYVQNIIKKIPVLVYAGDKDYICDWMGVKAWTEAMEWSGKAGFNKTPLKPFMVNGKELGQIKKFQGLTYARIYGGGHLASVEAPESVSGLIREFIGMNTLSQPLLNRPGQVRNSAGVRPIY
ncbi:hypothetical protein AA313_de0202394 [Arthrobotrys entomopaga]|nr:hypothetical protein AA313_de0202394 [Arthrobotrys entomopaga]